MFEFHSSFKNVKRFLSWKISIVLSVSNFVVLCYARRLVLLFSDFYQYNANGLCEDSWPKSRWPLLIFHFGCTSRYICWSYADWNHQIRDRPDVDGCANARAYLSSGEKGMKIFYVYDKHNNSSINYRRIVNYLCCNSTAPRWAPNRAHYFSPYLFIQFLFLSLIFCSVLIEK